jgi:predicted ATP-dependent endonuclease of OLD family
MSFQESHAASATTILCSCASNFSSMYHTLDLIVIVKKRLVGRQRLGFGVTVKPMGIVEVEVCNFKSYSGVQTLGPFKTFTAVVGPNGAGKSNVMDALCFALGLKSAQLRGHNLGDLVHARGEGRIAPSSGYVEIVFEETPGKARLRFKRSVTRSGSSEYFIDGKSISWKKYEQSLLSVGINVKAKNFLVFQGDVECIAQKSPSELVELVRSFDCFLVDFSLIKSLGLQSSRMNTLAWIKKQQIENLSICLPLIDERI